MIVVPKVLSEVTLNPVAVPAAPPSVHPHMKVSTPPNLVISVDAVTALETEMLVFSSILIVPSSTYVVTLAKQSPPITIMSALTTIVAGAVVEAYPEMEIVSRVSQTAVT